MILYLNKDFASYYLHGCFESLIVYLNANNEIQWFDNDDAAPPEEFWDAGWITAGCVARSFDPETSKAECLIIADTTLFRVDVTVDCESERVEFEFYEVKVQLPIESWMNTSEDRYWLTSGAHNGVFLYDSASTKPKLHVLKQTSMLQWKAFEVYNTCQMHKASHPPVVLNNCLCFIGKNTCYVPLLDAWMCNDDIRTIILHWARSVLTLPFSHAILELIVTYSN